MTPQIALDLSADGIAVLSRAPDGPDRGKWYREGVVRLDDPEMGRRLRAMRGRCVERLGDDFTSILVIPESQLLLTSLERDDRDPKVTIRSQLAGRTPYAVDDLAFDYIERGDRLQVAVVARETLGEAESFAAEFGFRPVAHVAAPDDSAFEGLARFGPTSLARALTEGERVLLDLGHRLEVVQAPDPARPPEGDAAEPAPEDGAASGAGAGDEAADDPGRAFAALVAEDAVEAPPAHAVPEGLPPAARPPTEPVLVHPAAASPAPQPAPPQPGGDGPTFSSRRKPAGQAPRLGTPKLAPSAAAPAPPMRARPAPAMAAAAEAGGEAPPSPPPAQPQPSEDAAAVAPVPVEAVAGATASLQRSTSPLASAAVTETPPARPVGRLARLGGRLGGRDRATPPTSSTPAPSASRMAADGGLSETQALSLPGRGRAAQPRRGTARLGLYLTLSLLALLVLVGLWAVTGGADEGPTDAIPTDGPAEQLGTAEPAPEVDVAALLPAAGASPAPGEASGLVSPPIPAPAAASAAPVPADAPTPVPADAPTEPFPDEPTMDAVAPAGRFDDAPGLARPPAAPDVTEIYLASIDAAVADGDAVALPALAAPADAPAPQTSPAPAGTDFPTGADGLVAATTEGALAPGGYRVVSGRPEIMPVPREDDAPAAVAATEPAADAARAEMRRVSPTPRPADAGARVERASFGGLSRAEITRVVPRQRPEAVLAQGAARAAEVAAADAEEAAIIAAEEAEADAAVEAATASAAASLARPADVRVVEPIGEGSRYALAQSGRPSGRPRSVEQDAARIVTARRENPAAVAAPQAQASAPQPQSSGQTIRSAGDSVARAATESGALRLRETNLIGVYGRASDRRALVRLSNGRYVKVKVGDQLDRGRVVAIGESEVVYQRGGRNVALRMPST